MNLNFDDLLGTPSIPALAFRSAPYEGEWKYLWRFGDLWLLLQVDSPIHWSLVPMSIPQVEDLIHTLLVAGWEIRYQAPDLNIKTVMFFTEGENDES